MEKPPAFVVPAGVTFHIGDDGVTIENQGDIVLHTNFGRSFTRVVSTAGSVEIHASAQAGKVEAAGDVVIHGDLQADEVQAGGRVAVSGDGTVKGLRAGSVQVGGSVASTQIEAGGDVEIGGSARADRLIAGGAVRVQGALNAGTVRGQDVDLAGPSVTARGIQGGRSVRLGGAKVQVDAILAPEVHVEPTTSGRVTVVECQNELGPNAIKGRFRLADYEEMFGDPAAFLAERGLGGSLPTPSAPPAPVATPVVEPPAPPPPARKARAAEPPPPPAPEPVAEVVEAAPAPAVDTSSAPTMSMDTEPEAPTVVAAAPPTPVQMEIEEEEPAPYTNGRQVPEHPLHPQLMEAVLRILDCYGGAEVPPAVTHLRELIDTRQYDHVRGEITTIWSDLLKFHQKKGMRIQHQVTTTFNTINSLVKKM